MNEDWTQTPDAHRVLALENDPRPAWLWTGDGTSLLWHNAAAELFGAKLKASGLKRAEPARPIKGQITRILRLGLVGRPTLSRMQFIAGRKPLSATCICTPLALAEQTPSLLTVGVDPIAKEIRAAAAPDDTPDSAQKDTPPDAAPEEAETEAKAEPANGEPDSIEPEPGPENFGLSTLFAKLAENDALYEPLGETDDLPLPPEATPAPVPHTPPPQEETQASESEHARDQSDWGEDAEGDDSAVFDSDSGREGSAQTGLWQITGRGITPAAPSGKAEAPEPAAEEAPEAPAPESEDRVARYNFDELARILNDRIGRESEPAPADANAEPQDDTPRASGSLVTLSEETLVLNRLPLGLLIFRDQDIVFVNRALVELTGYDSATALRAMGLGAVLPMLDASKTAGQVTQLLRRDGHKIAVCARLQTITWQGQSAFMLSARAVDSAVLEEGEVKRFAQLAASLSGDVFLAADASGTITEISGAQPGQNGTAPARGTTLAALTAPQSAQDLERFLNLPARFAESRRPAVALKGKTPGTQLKLFAQGRAGVVSGYFGILEGPEAPQAAPSKAHRSVPTATLSRISHEVRRPLNTISGFAELIASEAFGPISNPRYIEYARDIVSASQAIGELADELDDFVRLANGDLRLSPKDIDLAALLGECLMRVRGHAGSARVLLRSAISERLPHVRADEITLKQTVLNILASAIALSGEGSKVVLSAQCEDDGSVSIHVRDAAKSPNALTEQFVVFRDGLDKNGAARMPVRSSIGLTLTRSLAAVNACSLELAPASETGTLITLAIPADLVVTDAGTS